MELADVVDSKSTASDSVPVRVRPPAPKKDALIIRASFCFVFINLKFRKPREFLRFDWEI